MSHDFAEAVCKNASLLNMLVLPGLEISLFSGLVQGKYSGKVGTCISHVNLDKPDEKWANVRNDIVFLVPEFSVSVWSRLKI